MGAGPAKRPRPRCGLGPAGRSAKQSGRILVAPAAHAPPYWLLKEVYHATGSAAGAAIFPVCAAQYGQPAALRLFCGGGRLFHRPQHGRRGPGRHQRGLAAGAGAAGSAIAKLLLHAGAKNIILYDINGVVYKGREANDKYLEELAQLTNPNGERGTLDDIIKNADIFIGVSKGGLLTKDMVEKMEYRPIIFALANPEPEIMPDDAKAAGAYIVATGRSDYPNQINNLLVFPGLFKGLLDGNIKKVTDDIKLECAIMTASLVDEEDLSVDFIVPDSLNRLLPIQMAQAIVNKFAHKS